MPDVERVRRGLERAEFVVVQEAYRNTDTAAFADLLLPAQPGAHVAKLAAKIVKRIKQKEGRGEPPKNESQWRPKENRRGEWNYG